LKKKLTLGISPCPNDTFIFYALINGKIKSDNFDIEVVFEDVETLNTYALQGTLDVTKISFAHYFNVHKNYILLRSGSALGDNCGPLLICKKGKVEEIQSKIEHKIFDFSIAIPGKFTTAYFLLKYALGNNLKVQELVFNDIENALLNNTFDAGLIIHENRFTYKEKGLVEILDLGKYWQENEKLKIPLGGIVMKNSFSENDILAFSNLIKQSIEFANTNEAETLNFVKNYAQEMSIEVIKKHIELYVNEESVELSNEGKIAIQQMAVALGFDKTNNWII
jgi:1,4-dihydroxy-6-naphthoate synthase